MENKGKVIRVKVYLAKITKRNETEKSETDHDALGTNSNGIKVRERSGLNIKKTIHRSTLSLNIPSQSSPRMKKIKKMNEKDSKKKLMPSKLCPKANFYENKENRHSKSNLIKIEKLPSPLKTLPGKENFSSPIEIPANLVKSSRRLALNSILLTTSKLNAH